jgi:hypothetical protein
MPYWIRTFLRYKSAPLPSIREKSARKNECDIEHQEHSQVPLQTPFLVWFPPNCDTKEAFANEEDFTKTSLHLNA